MARDIIPHRINDWSKIDERDSFWGRIDLLRPEDNFGIHRYNNDLWTSGMAGVGRVFDKNRRPIQDNGKEHILIISSSYGMDPWKMLETVMLDDEYDVYMAEMEEEKRFLFRIYYDQPLIKLPQDTNIEAEILFALSYINACHSLCKKGLKKSIINNSENLTAKVRGKIDVNKNIKHNTARGRCDRFYCRYLDFTEDTIENRIIKAALLKCQAILKRRFKEETTVRGKLNYCLNSLRRVKTVAIDNGDFNNTSIGGLYSYYKPVIHQARAIMNLNFYSYPTASQDKPRKDVFTIPYAINMETLFEYYSRTELKRALASSRYRVEQYAKRLFLQRNINKAEDAEKNIHLMTFCIPDIIIYENDAPVAVIDAKYKPIGRPDRSDSHQLLAYVLLTGVDKCAFILPGNRTQIREMTTGNNYLPLVPKRLRYYELLLGSCSDSEELRKILE